MAKYSMIAKLVLLTGVCFICSVVLAQRNGTIANPVDICSRSILLSGNDWKLAKDSGNEGIGREWFKTPPVANAKVTAVPWVIQDVFHNYHGVAWYWRHFESPIKKQDGRYIIRFQTVDYAAQVWLNGVKVGWHEGGEFSFEVDVTKALNYGGSNLLVVRVLNPDYRPIDDLLLKETPSSLKHHPYTSNAVYNSGGITGNVELLSVADVRIEDLFVIADWKTGVVRVKASISSAVAMLRGNIIFKIEEARSGQSLVAKATTQSIAAGVNNIEAFLQVPAHKLWSPDEPFLYRMEVAVLGKNCIEDRSVRFGFRDFRFENGYFRLNGKRIFLIGCNFSTHYPVGYTIPLYEDMLRKDVVHMKALGQNFVRIPFGCPNPRIFDIYDELGILVHQEHYGSWQMNEFGGYRYDRPAAMKDSILQRFERSITGVIKRDRNHPSIVMWGALNENHEGIVFRKAVQLLPMLRQLDSTRMIVLNSGRFDKDTTIGSLSNPGSPTWDVAERRMKDWHPYVPIPYTTATLQALSGQTGTIAGQKIYVSESGLCFPIDLPSELGDYQLWNKQHADDAVYFKRQYDKFLTDWERFGLQDIWASPADYIQEAYKTAAELRQLGDAAIRSNPAVVAYTPTNGVADYSMGESVATNFRRLKPALIPAVLLANNPLRWCLFTEPQSIYNGDSLSIRASFSNLDVLPFGTYPATIKIVAPDVTTVYEKKVKMVVGGNEDPYAQLLLQDKMIFNGRAGKYRLLAQLDSGGTAVGGETDFYVSAKENTVELPASVVAYGDDSLLQKALQRLSIRIVPLQLNKRANKQLILISGSKAPDSTDMLRIAEHLVRGGSVIFLKPSVLKRGEQSSGWLPLSKKGIIQPVDHVAGYYRADRWAKKHPVLEGLQASGMLNNKLFRNLIAVPALCQEYNVSAMPVHTWEEATEPLTYPDETIFGATRISHNYCSGVQLGLWKFGAGKFFVNTLQLVENLGVDPAADMLFRNLLRTAMPEGNSPLTELPADWQAQLQKIGFVP